MKAFWVAAVAALGWVLGAGSLRADDYPSRYVTLIVPYAAGGPTDAYARLVADGMSRSLGQQVVVENLAGAGSTIGTGRVATGQPDGYTLLINQVGLPISAALYPNLNFDPARDLGGIGLINYGPAVIIGRKSLPAEDLPGLLRWMKEPGRVVRFAHAGVGTLAHLCGVLFADAMGVSADQIPYRGGGPALNDVLAGHVDLNCAGLTVADQIRAGTVKGFGVTAKEPLPGLPELPGLAGLGYPTLDINSWHGLFLRAGTPNAIVEKLNTALRSALADSKTLAAFSQSGVSVYPAQGQNPEAAMDLLAREIEQWRAVIRSHNINAPG